MSAFKVIKLFNAVDTVNGHCDYCQEDSIMVAVIKDFYRCTSCGEDTKQHINGHIKYIKLTNEDQEWLRKQKDYTQR